MHQNRLGEMVRKGEKFPNKRSGINSSKVCNSNIHKRTIKYSNSLADRQQDCTFIPFENGQQRCLAHQQVHLELPSQQTNCNVCRVSSQCSECTCRLGVTKRQGQFRTETRCFRFSRDSNTMADFFTSRLYDQLPRYIPWKTDPASIATDAFLHPWDREYCFTFPPFSLISRVLWKILEEKIDHLIIVRLTWQTQPWYAQFLKCLYNHHFVWLR